MEVGINFVLDPTFTKINYTRGTGGVKTALVYSKGPLLKLQISECDGGL